MSQTLSPPHVNPATSDAGRFEFGANWRRFLATLTEERIGAAMMSLQRVFGDDGLRGRTFLDIGSGSGLFSLAAYRLGARVHSFDYDADSVACTAYLREREGADAERWCVERGSVLDAEYLTRLGAFDVVYSWGVLHHTGDLWRAIEFASQRVAPGGEFLIAIYNDQGVWSRIWTGIKRAYGMLPRWLRPAYVAVVGGGWALQRGLLKVLLITGGMLVRALTLRNPWERWTRAQQDLAASQRRRGMLFWYDLVDWIGGYPFEVSTPEGVFRFVRDRGFTLVDLTTCGGGLGCNEFVFRRNETAARQSRATP
ncbi:MAG: class I SAM-dependent methyltransferase [Planctomycetaceae bacterium]|nr:class I SAM-dependent methyltransferase [Planctomycetaceae bacterium]